MTQPSVHSGGGSVAVAVGMGNRFIFLVLVLLFAHTKEFSVSSEQIILH